MSDPRFLGGAEGVVLTNSADMALTLTVDHDGTADIRCFVPKQQAAAWLRYLADRFDAEARQGGPS